VSSGSVMELVCPGDKVVSHLLPSTKRLN